MANAKISPIRFEVIVNGRRVAITGLDTLGVLSAHLSFVVRDPAEVTSKGQAMETFEERLPDTSYLECGGLDSAADKDLFWAREALRPGDEVTIRILHAGEYDNPRSDA